MEKNNEAFRRACDHYTSNGWKIIAIVQRQGWTDLYDVITRRESSPFGPDRVYQVSTATPYGISGHTYDLTLTEAFESIDPYRIREDS